MEIQPDLITAKPVQGSITERIQFFLINLQAF